MKVVLCVLMGFTIGKKKNATEFSFLLNSDA